MQGSDPSFPIQASNARRALSPEPGLTKREFFAACALAGLLADSIPRKQAAPFAVVAADALIEELNGNGKKP
jgi:hypothetical protein